MYDKSQAAPQPSAAPQAADEQNGGNGSASAASAASTQPPAKPSSAAPAAPQNGATQATGSNGHKAVDFVSEDDVRRALQKGEKIYINSKTIITPAARDMGEPAEVFAKG
jgi:hypothetical protein